MLISAIGYNTSRRPDRLPRSPDNSAGVEPMGAEKWILCATRTTIPSRVHGLRFEKDKVLESERGFGSSLIRTHTDALDIYKFICATVC